MLPVFEIILVFLYSFDCDFLSNSQQSVTEVCYDATGTTGSYASPVLSACIHTIFLVQIVFVNEIYAVKKWTNLSHRLCDGNALWQPNYGYDIWQKTTTPTSSHDIVRIH